jgi:hypothetical protein
MMTSLSSKWAAGKAVRAGLALEGAYLNGYVTDEQRSRRPVLIVSPTHGEGRRIAAAVRKELRRVGPWSTAPGPRDRCHEPCEPCFTQNLPDDCLSAICSAGFSDIICQCNILYSGHIRRARPAGLEPATHGLMPGFYCLKNF